MPPLSKRRAIIGFSNAPYGRGEIPIFTADETEGRSRQHIDCVPKALSRLRCPCEHRRSGGKTGVAVGSISHYRRCPALCFDFAHLVKRGGIGRRLRVAKPTFRHSLALQYTQSLCLNLGKQSVLLFRVKFRNVCIR